MGIIKKIFKRKPKKFLGIDMGSTSIRMVELRRKGKNIFIENYAESTAPFLENNKELPTEEEASNIIKTMAKKAKISTKNVNVAIPDFHTFYSNFELPSMAKEEINQAIEYEIRPYIPLPLSEITLDWSIIEGEVSKTPLDFLIVAIPNEVIFKYKNIVSKSGLNLKFLEPEASSLARALISNEDSEKIIGIIDLGKRSTTCSIIDHGVLKVSYGIKIGGEKITNALAKNLNISYNEAERLKIENGLIRRDDIKRIILPIIDTCIEETEGVLRDYLRKKERVVQKVIIFGKSSLMPGLKDYFSKKINRNVEFADPFVNISPSADLMKIGLERKMSLAIPIGIAMKDLK